MTWAVTFFDNAVEVEIYALLAGFLARFLKYAERMEVYGPDLGMPHTRVMGHGLYELRLKAAEGIARVLFCMGSGRKIVMLHSFIKKSEKTPPKELKIARERMKELKDG
jgi:phage-related protein